MPDLLKRILRWVDSATALRERGEKLPETMRAMLDGLMCEWAILIAMREGISMDDADELLEKDYVTRLLVRAMYGKEL